ALTEIGGFLVPPADRPARATAGRVVDPPGRVAAPPRPGPTPAAGPPRTWGRTRRGGLPPDRGGPGGAGHRAPFKEETRRHPSPPHIAVGPGRPSRRGRPGRRREPRHLPAQEHRDGHR